MDRNCLESLFQLGRLHWKQASGVPVEIIFTWPVQMDGNRLESLFQFNMLHWNTDQWCYSTDYIYLTSPNGQEPP
jgi:hypothetical protein